MQQPTLTDVHIRTVQDAHKLFYAVQLGLLPKIEKRLNAQERNALRPGNVYVWEERAPSTDSFSVSMERFTEGRSWTASRVREVCAFHKRGSRIPSCSLIDRISSCILKTQRKSKGVAMPSAPGERALMPQHSRRTS